MTLPYDYARCSGSGQTICQACRRREQGRDYYQVIVEPMAKDNECEMYIKPAVEANIG